MTIPALPIENATIAERLFAEMPSGFSADSMLENLLAIRVFAPVSSSANDKITMTIQDGILTISPKVTYIDPEYIDMREKTIRQLMEHFNQKYPSGYQDGGISVSLYENASANSLDLLSTILLEGSLEIDTSITLWPKFTAPNHQLIFSLMLTLREHHQSVKNALRQTDLRVASGQWLNYWGDILGIPRSTSEIGLDENYRGRLLWETIMPKTNNWAIADILENALNGRARVVDGGAPFLLVNATTGASSDSKLLFPADLDNASVPILTQPGYYGELYYYQPVLNQPGRWYTCIAPESDTASAIWKVLPDSRHHLATSSILAFSGLLPTTTPIPKHTYYGTDEVVVTSVNRTLSNGRFSGSIDITRLSSNGYQILHVNSVSTAGFVLEPGMMISISPVAVSSSPELSDGTTILSRIEGTSASVFEYEISTFASANIGPVNFDAGYSLWSQIDPTSPFSTSEERNMNRLGPLTGIGTFTVYVEADQADGTISPRLYSLVYQLVNRYKATGVSFIVKPLQ
jgi:hypothetical protein